MMSKTFEFYLILHYKTGKTRILTTKRFRKSDLSPYEIPIKVTIKVNVPEKPIMQARGEITLSEEKVTDILIEEL